MNPIGKSSNNGAGREKASPFYFKSEGQNLFGLYTPPSERDEAVVICYPAPQDIMRSLQAHVQLHRRLQDLGYAVLRFDYAGTGDSEGEGFSLDLWRKNILSAIAQAKRLSGVSRISLLGTRLGGTLALQASSLVGVKRLVLWDAVLEGAGLIRDYERAHHNLLNRVPDEAPFLATQKNPDQCCGFPWPESLRQEIGAIRPETLVSDCPRILHVQSEPQSAWPDVSERFIAEGKTVRTITTDETIHWADDLYIRLRALPQRSLLALAQIFEEA